MPSKRSRSPGRIIGNPTVPVPSSAVGNTLTAALAHHHAKEYAKATLLYQEVLRIQPENADALHLFGVLQAQTGHAEDAVELLQQAVYLSPRQASFASDLGNALSALTRHDDAIKACRRAARLDPRTAYTHYNLGNALRSAGRLSGAAKAYRKALALQANYLPAQTHLGLALLDQGLYADAAAALTAAVKIAPESAEAHSNLANALHKLGERERAEEHLRRAIRLDPSHAISHCNLGNVLQDLRQVTATEAYRQAIELDPDYAIAHSNLGNVLKSLGRFTEAVTHGLRAVELEPENDTFLSNLGMAYIANGATAHALDCFARATTIRHGSPLSVDKLASSLSSEPAVSLADTMDPAPFKLLHDAEQIRYLCGRGLLPTPFGYIADAYEKILAALPTSRAPEKPIKLGETKQRRIASFYNRPIFIPNLSICETGALNPALNTETIEEAYLDSTPNLVYFDNFLRPEVLDQLRHFCLEATIWYQVKNGYLGTYLVDGFATPLVLQIAEELRAHFPRIFQSYPLNQLWAYKYDSRLRGIRTHADFAAINVNFWITPDSANKDPDGGGLVIHKSKAPNNWAFEKFNSDSAAMTKFLAQKEAGTLTVPYRCNRAAIFDSNLFHQTDDLDFEPGYENRRINITMLFGERSDV